MMRHPSINRLFLCGLAIATSIYAGMGMADEWLSQAGAIIPPPGITHTSGQILTLEDAIFLSLRNNPDVENAELTRVNDKFSLLMAYNAFFPQYTLGSTMAVPDEGQSTYGTTAGITWNSPLGTTVDAGYTKSYNGGPGATTLTITQPLLRGFGYAYNTIAFQNSLDAELTAKLNYKSSIITAVVGVITDYRSLVEDYNQLDIQGKTLKQNEEQLRQNELQVKAGVLAPSDLLQKKASLESFRLSFVQTQNTLQTAYKTLLNDLGLSPDAVINIDKKIVLPARYKVPNLAATLAEALQGNIPYVQQVIALRASERAVYQAERNRWWQLSLQSTNTFGYNGPFINSGDTGPDLLFTLNIPINDLAAEQTLVSSKIALINAKNNLTTTKRNLISTVTQELETIENAVEQVKISKMQVGLQQQTVNDTQIRIKYGKSTMFELTTEQTNLLSQQTSLISTEIGLLNDITTLNQTLGKTLDVWGVRLKY